MNERYEQLKQMAEKAWFVFHNERDYAHENAMLLDQLDRFAKQVESEAVAREREACAIIVNGRWLEGLSYQGCADAIRARSEN